MGLINWIKNPQNYRQSQALPKEESSYKLFKEKNLKIDDSEVLTTANDYFEGKKFGIKLDKILSKKIAILEVESLDGEKIIIHFHHGLLGKDEQLYTKCINAPKISFDKTMKAQNLDRMIGDMTMFSEENPQVKKLRGWLLKLQEKLKNNFDNQLSYLIINDRTDFEIPWEMLELKNNYLGASIVTVRWQDITNPDDLYDVNSLIDLQIEENNCCGNMVAYLNTKDLPSVEEERKNLEQFNPIVHDNIRKFFDFLESVGSKDSEDFNISLIFIASHGFFGNDLSDSKLGGEDSKQQISLSQLYEYKWKFLAQKSSLVFMNTCHSGRLQQEDQLNVIGINPKTEKPYAMGFSTFFLKKGAAGVIGTLCKVADQYAAKISHNFFEEYQECPQLPVATILKNLRLKASQKYQSERNDENKYLLLFTFMYVYYGNPMTKLTLTSKEGC